MHFRSASWPIVVGVLGVLALVFGAFWRPDNPQFPVLDSVLSLRVPEGSSLQSIDISMDWLGPDGSPHQDPNNFIDGGRGDEDWYLQIGVKLRGSGPVDLGFYGPVWLNLEGEGLALGQNTTVNRPDDQFYHATIAASSSATSYDFSLLPSDPARQVGDLAGAGPMSFSFPAVSVDYAGGTGEVPPTQTVHAKVGTVKADTVLLSGPPPTVPFSWDSRLINEERMDQTGRGAYLDVIGPILLTTVQRQATDQQHAFYSGLALGLGIPLLLEALRTLWVGTAREQSTAQPGP